MSQTIVLGSPVQCTDTHGSLQLLRPRISGFVLEPSATQLAYLVVHRGFLGGHDQCVPAADVREASPEGVLLAISFAELKAMPDLEARVPGQDYTQRSVPASAIIVGKGLPVTDEAEQVLGHVYGVVVDTERQLAQILLDQPGHPGIPVEQLTTWSEVGLKVQQPTTPAPEVRAHSGAIVRDPVCDREVDPDTALTTEHDGQRYSFCSRACQQTFDADPQRYTTKARTA
jgi:YHS domain-containing protein